MRCGPAGREGGGTWAVRASAGGLRPLHPSRMWALPRTSTTCTVGEDAGGLCPPRPPAKGLAPLCTPPSRRAVPCCCQAAYPTHCRAEPSALAGGRSPVGVVCEHRLCRALPHTGFWKACLRRNGVGMPDRAGRNQRVRATALGQGLSPLMSRVRVARRPWARHWPPAWGPGARPLARGSPEGLAPAPSGPGCGTADAVARSACARAARAARHRLTLWVGEWGGSARAAGAGTTWAGGAGATASRL